MARRRWIILLPTRSTISDELHGMSTVLWLELSTMVHRDETDLFALARLVLFSVRPAKGLLTRFACLRSVVAPRALPLVVPGERGAAGADDIEAGRIPARDVLFSLPAVLCAVCMI